MQQPDNVIHLYCPAGFSYVHRNKVSARLNGKDVTSAVYDLLVAGLLPNLDGDDPEEPYLGWDRGEISTVYGESFGLDDFAETLRDLFKLEVQSYDGEGPT